MNRSARFTLVLAPVWLALVVALALASPFGAALAATAATTLRLIPQADLRVLDPIWTTASITRNYGYMVYDTLFALDSDFKPQPQMVDHWAVSADRLTYTFTLRDGLKFSDGQPVTSADCIASLERWSKRDPLGQTMASVVALYRSVDDKTFSIILKKPFPLLLDALAKPDSNVPFIMPKQVALTSANRQIKDTTGSGPFIFVKSEWEPGHKVVFVKNPEYVPRNGAPSWAAGGKVARVDRVEWLYIPDPGTALAAFQAGEADWWEDPPPDFYPLLDHDPSVTLVQESPFRVGGLLRFNQLQPPFDNVKMRQALLYAVDQSEYMAALAGDKKYWSTCFSFYSCGGPMASNAGARPLEGPRDLAKAKELIKEAGYHGEKVVLLDPTDFPTLHAMALVTNDLLHRLGINVELEAMDWGTLVSRRASKAPIDHGGWNIFLTTFPGIAMLDPSVNAPLRADGPAAWPGWPDDPIITKFEREWIFAPDEAARKTIAADLQREAFKSVPYIPTGEYSAREAYHTDLSGVIIAPGLFLWNVAKK
jgi:peptide/nickel transport system substrate-binding protein